MRRRLMSRLIAATLMVMSTACYLAMISPGGLLRGLTTNTAQFSPDATDPSLRTPRLSIPPDQAANLLEAWVREEPRWDVLLREQEDDDVRLHLTRTTRLFRFVDDIQMRLIADPMQDQVGTLVEAISQSRVGKGDLGQNPRNLQELQQAWNESVSQAK